jgi:hypothetical protein
MDEVEKFFFANFQILGPLGCQGWVVIPQNVKKSQNHCTLLYTYVGGGRSVEPERMGEGQQQFTKLVRNYQHD